MMSITSVVKNVDENLLIFMKFNETRSFLQYDIISTDLNLRIGFHTPVLFTFLFISWFKLNSWSFIIWLNIVWVLQLRQIFDIFTQPSLPRLVQN